MQIEEVSGGAVQVWNDGFASSPPASSVLASRVASSLPSLQPFPTPSLSPSLPSPPPQPFSILPLEVISTTIEGNIRELQATHGAAAAVPSPINDFIRPPASNGNGNGSSNGNGVQASLATAGAPNGRPSGGGAR